MAGNAVATGSKISTDRSKRDLWNTTKEAFLDAQYLVGEQFVIDVCAKDSKAAKCEFFITPEQDALKTAWVNPAAKGAAWCNPPFSEKFSFLERAYEQAKANGVTVCVMIPYEAVSGWWIKYVEDKATFVYLPDGRYSYSDDETKEVGQQPPFASCFVVFTPFHSTTVEVRFKRGIGKK